MGLRVIQWNVYGASDPDGIADFLTKRIGHGSTIVCLQDIKRASYKMLVGLLKPASSRFSLELREPSGNEGAERTTGIAMFGFGLPVVSLELLDRTLYPERTFSVLFGGAFGPIRVVAFDSLAGIYYPLAKNSNYASVADYLELHTLVLDFLCFDTYEPRQDGSGLQLHKKKAKGSALILGPQKVHDLSNSYAEYLRSRGEPVTESPHTESFALWLSGKKHAEEHYDYIMHSPRWHVTSCEYPCNESIKATSDHSAVIADFELE